MLSKIRFLVLIEIFLVFLYIAVLSTRNYDRVIQVSVILGISLGYYTYSPRKFFKGLHLKGFGIFMPLLAIIAANFLNYIRLNGVTITVISLAFYMPYLLGFVLVKLNLNKGIKNAILFGVLLVFLSAITRKLNHGTSASFTILLSILGSFILSRNSNDRLLRDQLVFVNVYLLIILILSSYPEVFQFAFLIIFVFLSAITVFHINRSTINTKSKLIRISLFAVLFMIVGWFGQENYETWFNAKLDNESIQEKVDYTFLTTENVRISSIDSADRKIIVLFWSEACASCKEEFPYFSELATKYENDSSKIFLAAYLSLKEDDTAYFNQITAQPFNFYWGRAANSEILMKQLKMKGVPHQTIIDEQNYAIYNGRVSNRPWIWVNRPSGFF